MAITDQNVMQWLDFSGVPGGTVGLWATAERIGDGKVWQKPADVDADGNLIPPGREGEGMFVPPDQADYSERRSVAAFGINKGGGRWIVAMDCRLPDGPYRFTVRRQIGAQPASSDPPFAIKCARRPFTLYPPEYGCPLDPAPVVRVAAATQVRPVQS